MSDNDALPPRRDPGDASRLQTSRTVLGALLALLTIAVLLALWFLIVGGDDETADGGVDVSTTVPTAIPIPSSTPTPVVVTNDTGDAAASPTPTVAPTAIPTGFEACGDERAPLVSSTYIVDTLTTPLNQRSEPSVDGALVGSFDPGQTGLTFSGECLVNLADGYVWWQTFNGDQDVWIASDFVTPNR